MLKPIQNRLLISILLMTLAGLSACTALPHGEADDEMESKPVLVGDWEHKTFPNKTATEYKLEEGAVAANADGTMSVLRQLLAVKPEELGEIDFSWRTKSSALEADVGDAKHDDAPARVVLVFDGDRAKLSHKDHMLSDLSRMMTGEPLPYATMAYVWSGKKYQQGEVVHNPRTSRIRNLVLDAGDFDAKTWRKHRRNIKQDYIKVFGEEPGKLLGIMLMSDTDNTKTKTHTWYGNIQLLDSKGKLVRKLQ